MKLKQNKWLAFLVGSFLIKGPKWCLNPLHISD